jgi:hypothetical protein
MTEPLAITYAPEETLTLTNVVGIATGEPIVPPAKPKRKYTRKTAKARAKRASKFNAAIMPKPSIGDLTLKDGQAANAIAAWPIPPVPPVSMMRSIYDLLPPRGGNNGVRIFRRSERFWLLLLSALSVSIGATAAVYWW